MAMGAGLFGFSPPLAFRSNNLTRESVGGMGESSALNVSPPDRRLGLGATGGLLTAPFDAAGPVTEA